MCQEAGEREWEVLDVRKEWQVRVSEEDACGVTCKGSYEDAHKKTCRDTDMEREEVRRKAQEAKLKAYKVVVTVALDSHIHAQTSCTQYTHHHQPPTQHKTYQKKKGSRGSQA